MGSDAEESVGEGQREDKSDPENAADGASRSTPSSPVASAKKKLVRRAPRVIDEEDSDAEGVLIFSAGHRRV